MRDLSQETQRISNTHYSSCDCLQAALGTFFRSLVLVYLLVLAFWYSSADKLKDLSGTPLGADFLGVYAAGVLAKGGHAVSVYDWGILGATEQAVAGYASPLFAFHYPPIFLSIAVLLSLLPYSAALLVYLGASLAAYFAAMTGIVGRSKHTLWMLAAFPGVYANIHNGQNGFITASLIGAGLLQLDKRPWLSGAAFGLLVYKPQFFLVVPILLMAGGYGKAALSSILSAGAALLCSWVAFGSGAWAGFLSSGDLTRRVVLEQGSAGWQKLQSLFAFVRIVGGDISTAYAIQGGGAVLALAMAIWIWHRNPPSGVRAASLCSALFLATPYALDYDLVVFAVPLAFLVREGGLNRFEGVGLSILWMLPLVARSWAGYGIPIAPFVIMGLMIVAYARTKKMTG